jgi:hypothetical protein
MNHLKKIVAVATTALATLALLGAGTASATELYKNTAPSPNDTLGVGTTLQMTLQAGSSLVLWDTFSMPYVVGTCTGSELQGKTSTAGGELSHPEGTLSTVSFTGCLEDPLITIANGAFRIQHIAGTTNATLIVNGMKFKYKNTFLGLECTVVMNGSFGTLTGATSASGHVKLDVFANLEATNCGTPARLTGSFTVTSPTGLVFEAK